MNYVAVAAAVIGVGALLFFRSEPHGTRGSKETERVELLMARLKLGQYCLKRRRGAAPTALGREAREAAATLRQAAESDPGARVGDQTNRLLLSDAVKSLSHRCDPTLAQELRESLERLSAP